MIAFTKELVKNWRVAMFLLIFTLSFNLALGQDMSNGGQPLPNRTVANFNSPDCTVTDSMYTFYNTRATQCDLFSTFRNGEIRYLTATGGPLYSDSSQQNPFGETSCATSGNATWVRNFFSTEDSLSYFVQWEASWWPRKADNNLDETGRKNFSWTACRTYKTIAEEPPAEGLSTPIAIDLNNDGVIRLTDKAGGVMFDLDMNGEKEQIPWLADSDDGWLVFAYNENGLITNGSQLFGPGDKNNGYLHLSGFDDNKDGQLDGRMVNNKWLDGIWHLLAIWLDKNHNGISEPGELLYLTASGIESISLDYKESRRKDKHGNEFRYRSKIKFADGREGFSFDIFLSAK